MILAQGARGPGLNPQNSPAQFLLASWASRHRLAVYNSRGQRLFAHHGTRPYTSEARLAQSAERKALNLVVVGSSPTVGVLSALHLCVVVIRLSPSLPEILVCIFSLACIGGLMVDSTLLHMYLHSHMHQRPLGGRVHDLSTT